MGNPSQHNCPGLLELLQLARHLLKGDQQFMNFPLFGPCVQNDIVLPAANLCCCGSYPLNRLCQLARQEVDGQPAQNDQEQNQNGEEGNLLLGDMAQRTFGLKHDNLPQGFVAMLNLGHSGLEFRTARAG
ncbi:hypothetical protein D3C80_1050700 [compost metagenome]